MLIRSCWCWESRCIVPVVSNFILFMGTVWEVPASVYEFEFGFRAGQTLWRRERYQVGAEIHSGIRVEYRQLLVWNVWNLKSEAWPVQGLAGLGPVIMGRVRFRAEKSLNSHNLSDMQATWKQRLEISQQIGAQTLYRNVGTMGSTW